MKKTASLIILLCCSCALLAQNVHVSGSFINRKYSNEVIVMNAYNQQMIASAPMTADSFSVDFNLEKSEYIYIGPDQYNVVLLVASPGETIRIIADIDDITHPIVTGSVLTDKMYQMMDKNDAYTAKADSIYRTADSLSFLIEQQRKDYFRNIFIKEEPTLASLVFLDMLDPVKDSILFRDVIENLQKKFPDNEFVKDYVIELRNAPLSFDKGSTPPDIIMNDPANNPVALSSFKGKIVLVDFWASWCKPCLAEIPNLVELYKKYHKKGFEIYSISLDRDYPAWVEAIDKHNLNWTHVSDMKMWECKAAVDWNVASIPATYLLDRNGVIIEKDISGEKLKEVLDTLFE